jgi:hypothetical protein
MRQSMRLIIKERRFSKFIPSNLPLSLKFCSLTLDENDGAGDDVKVEGAVMAMRLLGNFGRYSIQLFRISYKTGNNDDNNDDGNTEEADSMPMTRCVAYRTLTCGHFDVKLIFSLEETTKDNSYAVVVSMTLVIPDGSQALLVHLAKAMVLSFTHSIPGLIQIQITYLANPC